MNLRSLLNVDLLAGLGAASWAIASQYVPSMVVLASPEVAAGFALAAFGRWMLARKTDEG